MRSDVRFGLHDPRRVGPSLPAMDENSADQIPGERFRITTIELATEFFQWRPPGCKYSSSARLEYQKKEVRVKHSSLPSDEHIKGPDAERGWFTASISTPYNLDTVKILDAGADGVYSNNQEDNNPDRSVRALGRNTVCW